MPRRRPILFLLMLLAGCTGVPEGVQPVTGFELERYLGTWYEIARLDHPFERGLSRVTAEYSRRDDGGVRVVNRGYAAADGRWNQVEGKAYFVESPDLGRLKVSFFGPFYGGYNIFALGPTGTGKRSVITQYFERQAKAASAPADWCYINNFEESHRPKAIQLPAGKGVACAKDV